MYNFITVIIFWIPSLPTPVSAVSCSFLVAVVPVPIPVISSVAISSLIIVSVSVTWPFIIPVSVIFFIVIIIITISVSILSITFITITIARPVPISVSISAVTGLIITIISTFCWFFATLPFLVIISVTTKWIWSSPVPWIWTSPPVLSCIRPTIPKTAQLTTNVAFEITVSPILILVTASVIWASPQITCVIFNPTLVFQTKDGRNEYHWKHTDLLTLLTSGITEWPVTLAYLPFKTCLKRIDDGFYQNAFWLISLL